MSNKSAVITGASTGIGRAIAKTLIDADWQVFGSVRKESDAQSLREEFGDKFTPLLFDITDPASIRAGAETVKKALNGATLGGLINNAGVAIGGPLLYLPPEELRRQLDINVMGPFYACQAFGPLLGADNNLTGPPGRIINMSSVAGKIASPILGPYAMSKHALEAFSDSLRRELLIHGIDVITIGPGAVQTPIWAKADEIDANEYKDTEYYSILMGMRDAFREVGEQGLPASDIGELALNILTTAKPKTRYAVLRQKFLMWTLPRLLPTRWLDRIIANRFKIPARKK